MIPGVGDVYSSLPYEPPEITDVAKSCDVTLSATDVITTNGAAPEPLKMSPVTADGKAEAGGLGTESTVGAKEKQSSAPSVVPPATRAVSADLLAELKALASSAEGQQPSVDAVTKTLGDGKQHQDHHHHQRQQERDRTAAGEPTLLLQDLESPTSVTAAAGTHRLSTSDPRSALHPTSHPDARPEPRLDSLSDSDASECPRGRHRVARGASRRGRSASLACRLRFTR